MIMQKSYWDDSIDDGTWTTDDEYYIQKQGTFDVIWACDESENQHSDAMDEEYQFSLGSQEELSWDHLLTNSAVVTEDWSNWRDEVSDLHDYYVESDAFTQEQYAQKIAHQLLEDFSWPNKYLPFLIDVFSKPHQNAVKAALYRAAERGIHPEMAVCAYKLKKYWEYNPQWHISVRYLSKRNKTTDAHWFLPWTLTFKILSCFSGIPCVEEVVEYLDKLYDCWYNSVDLQNEYKSFRDFVSYQAEYPVECWWFDYVDQKDFNKQLLLEIPLFSNDSMMPAAYRLYEEDALTTWERHCILISEWVASGEQYADIFRKIPLDLNVWPKSAQLIFRQSNVTNLYDALRVIYTQLDQKEDFLLCKTIVQAYRDCLNSSLDNS